MERRKNDMNRREFLRTSTLVAGGAYLGLRAGNAVAGMMGGGGGGMGGGGTGGGGTGTIDPPPGAAFRDPVVLRNQSATPGLVEVDVEAMPAPVDVNGVSANLLTYNGYYPAPTIFAKKGDLLRVNFTNSLPPGGTNILGHERDITNIHTHGLHVTPGDNMNGTHGDNMFVMLQPGESTVYEYDLSMQEAGTLNFYHPHIHGTVAEQYWGGLAGALVIEDETPALSGYETHIMVLKDITLSGSDPEPYTSTMDYMHGKEGAVVMVNGQVNPVLSIRPGQVQRWRILNASNARFYNLSVEGHTVYLVGTEGGLLDRPYPVSRIVLAPGERVELLVKADRKAQSYRFLSLPYDRGGMSGGQQVTLLTLSYKGTRAADAVPASINPNAARATGYTVAKTERLVLSMGRGRGYINGLTFLDHVNCFAIHSELGTWEVWEIVNQSGMDHPFHQHVNPCRVLSVTGGDAAAAALYAGLPAWKDVVLVPKWGSVRILVPVMDYDGMAMFHCHIVEHEDIGMMGIWHIMGGM